MEQLRLLYYQVLHHTNFVVGADGDAADFQRFVEPLDDRQRVLPGGTD
jgi:hypothetical protein